MENALNTLWACLNSPLAITAFAAAMLWLLNRLYARKPAWANYEGTIITAIKAAEKAIPDDSDNTAVARLNNALQYVLAVYEKVEGKRADATTASQLSEGIQILHAKLESHGNLDSSSNTSSEVRES